MAERKRKPAPSSERPISSSSQARAAMSTDSMVSGRVSLRSDHSKAQPIYFAPEKPESSQARAAMSTDSMMSGRVSLRSDRSKAQPIYFAPESQETGALPACSECLEDVTDGVQLPCGHWSCKRCVGSDLDWSDRPADVRCPKCAKRLRKEPQEQGSEGTGRGIFWEEKKNFKKDMRRKFAVTSEGTGDQASSLNDIYTDLHVTSGESAGQLAAHEFSQLQRRLIEQSSSKSVSLIDIFEPLPGQDRPHRTVVTKGIAGIGKSFAVQKFLFDWANGDANQDAEFVFCVAFRELNLTVGTKSLHGLLTEFHPALQSLEDSDVLAKVKVIVILDGLDESRRQLDFEAKTVTSVHEESSVGNLLANLIKGNLLPDANIWITCRPVAADQIPATYVDMVTEIRGFNEAQKEQYFKKRFCNDVNLAERIISHIRLTPHLDIMCQIPIFCWLSSVLFQEVFAEGRAENPQTLTEMMAYFLFVQTKRRGRKYDKAAEKNEENLLKTHKEFLLQLGKLAFVHLQNNNLIFYEEDFKECGIDMNEATTLSGFCSGILREEVLFQKKVFFFVHLTVQEFFAALYVYDCFTHKNTTELANFIDLKQKDHTLLELLKMTLDKVLEKKNGHLRYFLRFLLGLLAESNRRILGGLLISPDQSQDTYKKILTHLKAIRRKTLSPDSCINIFRAMVEMRDVKVKDEIEEYLKSPDCSAVELTLPHCSALAYMLQVSRNDLDVFDLRSYNTSEEGRRRLIPAVGCSRKALLADCKVTPKWVPHLASVLKSPYSPLKHLDLSDNDLRDQGVELLCDGLSSQRCRLETLRLSGCLVTGVGCALLAAALKVNDSHLEELDLSYNHPGDSGRTLLSRLVDSPLYKLGKLVTDHGGSHRMKPGLKKYACEFTLDPNTAHRSLLLSDNKQKVTWVEARQSYHPHRERFDHWPQVLCEQGVDGRCYLEVEVLEPFKMGFTYKSIGRKGDADDCRLGCNDKSWCLTCADDGCHVVHNNQKISVSSLCSRSSRVAMYVDWPAGTLAFFRVSSDSRVCLHTFRATFREPLYAAAELHTHSSAAFCQM